PIVVAKLKGAGSHGELSGFPEGPEVARLAIHRLALASDERHSNRLSEFEAAVSPDGGVHLAPETVDARVATDAPLGVDRERLRARNCGHNLASERSEPPRAFRGG